jgi:hypothetical protein
MSRSERAMKTKPKLRARRLWANYYAGGDVLLHTTRKAAQSWALHDVTLAGVPVAVIPLDEITKLGDSMVSALTAIGVLPKRRKGGRK